MTGAIPRPPANPDAPEVVLPGTLQAAAGTAVAVPVRIRHRGRIPAGMRVTVLGLDSRWVPEPLELGPMQPGEAAEVTLTLVPERGALGARYPFVVAVEATPLRGTGAPVMGIAEAMLAVDSAERISMSIQPPAPTAVFGRKFRVEITNPSARDRSFQLEGSAAVGASVHLHQGEVQVPAQRTVSVRGRVRIRRPTLFGGENTHTFAVTAQGVGAPEFAEATVRSRPLIGRGARMAVGLALVVALWASLAVIFIPKISNAFKPTSVVGAPSTVTSQGPVAGSGATAPATSGGNGSNGNGNGGNGSGGSGSGGSGGAGSGGSGGSGSGGSAQPAGYQLSGTVTGPGAKGTIVTLTPTSLVGASDTGAKPAPGSSTSTVNALRSALSSALGKIPGQSLDAPRTSAGTVTVLTNAKGEFAFGGISSPGYYLLTLAKAGFQTQRFLINSTDLASPQPMTIALAPGTGRLSGTVSGPGGQPIGAAVITVTDGTTTLQTSSVSTSAATSGKPGTWRVDNLSTPGSYLITATAPGYGGSSALVTLGPSGTASSNLTLVPGQGSIVGTVSGEDELGNVGGLGGITVTATAGTVTRTATTVTSQALRGHFILPNMPTPGEYTLTISGDGFLTQTRTVTFAQGVGSATVDATLSRADSVVSGTVTGLDAHHKSQGGLVGVGLTLTSNTTTLKTMTTSGESAGGYRFTGVPPGTYVLTATQYGRATATATVELKASDNKIVNLSMATDIASELPTTAHIRGQVVDSRTGGPLTCDRTAVPIPAAACVATVTVTAPVNPIDPSKGTVTYSATSTAALNYVYTVPSLDDPTHPGLPPGLYTVTVSAPGYESTIAHVQVAQGQVAPAPQVSLPALGIISGTITTRVGTPSQPSCVVAVPATVTVPSAIPTSCEPNDTGTVCIVPGLGSQQCGITSEGGAGQSAAGTYQIRGLTHGRYQMLVIAQDPEYRYVIAAPPIVQIDVGSDGQFNAVLDRMGRIQLTVFNADRQTGALSPASGATLTVTPTGGSAQQAGKTAADGTAMITGLNGSYTVAATVGDTTTTGASGPVGLDQTTSMTLVIAAPQVPVVGQIQIAGFSAADAAQAFQPVAPTVTITGTVGYAGSTPLSGRATVTPDSNGCYAILPAKWKPPSGFSLSNAAAGCPNPVAAANTATMQYTTADGTQEPATLATDRIGIAVAALGNKTEGYPVTGSTIQGPKADPVRFIPQVNVSPTPVNFGPAPSDTQTLTINGPPTGYQAPDLSTANIVVINKPSLAGGVTIIAGSTTASTATGPISTSLSFSDTNLPTQGGSLPTAIPGTYVLQVTLANFVPATVGLYCPLGGTCYFVQPNTTTPLAGGLVLNQLPSISGIIPATSTTPAAGIIQAKQLPNGTAPDWSKAVINRVSGPTSLGNISVVADPNDPTKGIVHFDGATSVLAAANGTYVFSVALPGFATENSIRVTCGADFQTPPTASGTQPASTAITGCTRLEPTTGALTQLPTFSGSLTLKAPSGVTVPASAATVTAIDTVNAANTITVGVDGTTGAISWSDPPQPAGLVGVGSYAITATAPGFAPVTVPFSCSGGSVTCGPGTVTLKMLPQISGTITANNLPSGMTLGQVVITPKTWPSTAGALSASVDPTTGAVTFTDASLPPAGTNGLPADLAMPGTYTFSVALNGYQTAMVQVVCGSDYGWAGDATTSPAPVNGCQPLSATLATLPTLSGSTVSLSSTTSPYDDQTFSTSSVTAQVTPNPGSSISASVDSSGTVSWKDSSPGVLPGQVVPGSYTITYSLPGFVSAQASLTCGASASTCTQSPANVKLLMQPAAAGTLTMPLPAGSTLVNLNGVITVTGTKSSSTTSLTITLSATGTDANGNATANLIWSDKRMPFAGIVQPDTYSVSITLPGYQTDTVSGINCTQAGSTCTPSFTLTLNPQPKLALTVLPGTLTTPTLAVSGGPKNAPKVQLTADAQGNLTWQQGSQPAGVITPSPDATTPYIITVQMPGYAMVVNGTLPATPMTAQFSCTASSCVFPTIVLTAPSTLAITVQDANQVAAGTANLQLTRTVAGTTTTIGSPSTSNGTASFANLATTAVNATATTPADQSYSLTVDAAGFAFADGSNALTSSSPNVSCSNGTQTVTGLQIIPGGTTTCTVTLTRLGTITAATSWALNDLTGAQYGTQMLPSVSVTATLLNSNGTPSSTSFTQTSDTNGNLTITGTTTTAGLATGTWQITAQATGFAKLTGTVVIDSNHQMVQDTAATALPVTGGTLQIVLQPTDVHLSVHLQTGSPATDTLPAATVTLTDSSTSANTWTCTSPTKLSTDSSGCTIVSTGGKYIQFGPLPPGAYKVAVTFPANSYSDIPPTTVVVLPTGSDQQAPPFNLSAQVSSFTGGLVASNNSTITTAATVQLWQWGASTGPAKDFSGNDLTVTTTNGAFTFNQIVTGNYRIVVTAAGYAPFSSGILPIAYGTPTPAQTITLSVAKTDVSLVLTSLGGSALDLSGATVVLTPSGSSPHVPANQTITTPVTASGAVPISQVPSGTYSVRVTGQLNAPFPVDGNTTITVPDSVTGGGPYQATVALKEATTSITVTWTAVACLTSPGTLTSIPLTLTQGSGAGAPTGSASAAVSATNSDAVATVILPSGTYSWVPDLSGLSGWQAPSTAAATFSIADPAASPDPAPTAAITAATTTVTANLQVNGSASGLSSTVVTATCASDTTQTVPIPLTSGTGTAALANTAWNFTVGSTSGSNQISLPAQNNVTVGTGTGATSTVTFTGYSFSPTVTLASVASRPPDSRVVQVDLYQGATATGTAIWSATPTIWSALPTSPPAGAQTSYTGPTFVYPSGTVFSITATPPTGDDFAGQQALNIAINGSGSTHTTTLTLPYTLASATVTVNRPQNGNPASGATVTLQQAGSSSSQSCSSTSTGTNSSGVIVCTGLAPNSTYGVTAFWTSSNVSYIGYGTLTTGAAGSATGAVTINLTTGAALVTVTSDGTTPVQSASVQLYSSAGATVGSAATTNGLGQAYFTGLTAGATYYAIATTSGKSSGPLTLTPTTTAIATATATLAGTASLSLTFTPPAGVSSMKAAVTVKAGGATASAVTLYTGTTAPAGTLTVPGLPANTPVTISATWSSTASPPVTYAGSGSATTGDAGTTTDVPAITMTAQ